MALIPCERPGRNPFLFLHPVDQPITMENDVVYRPQVATRRVTDIFLIIDL